MPGKYMAWKVQPGACVDVLPRCSFPQPSQPRFQVLSTCKREPWERGCLSPSREGRQTLEASEKKSGDVFATIEIKTNRFIIKEFHLFSMKKNHWFNINLIINTFVSPSDFWLIMSLNTLVLIKVFIHKKSTFSRIDKFLSFLSANLQCLFFHCFIFSVKVLKKRTSSTTIIQGKLPRNLTWVYFQK